MLPRKRETPALGTVETAGDRAHKALGAANEALRKLGEHVAEAEERFQRLELCVKLLSDSLDSLRAQIAGRGLKKSAADLGPWHQIKEVSERTGVKGSTIRMRAQNQKDKRSEEWCRTGVNPDYPSRRYVNVDRMPDDYKRRYVSPGDDERP